MCTSWKWAVRGLGGRCKLILADLALRESRRDLYDMIMRYLEHLTPTRTELFLGDSLYTTLAFFVTHTPLFTHAFLQKQKHRKKYVARHRGLKA